MTHFAKPERTAARPVGDPIRIPVFVVIPPRLLLLDIAGPIEVLRQANRLQNKLHFDIRYIGPAAALRSSIGITVAGIEALPQNLPPNAWVVLAGDMAHLPANGDGLPDDDDQAKADAAAIVAWLKSTIQPSHKLISICTGALFAAAAGLLDGHFCTTHHANCAELAGLAPTAKILATRLYVEDRGIYSSAGITAGIDLMLHIVHQCTDHICAVGIARTLIVYARRNGDDPQLSPWLEGRNHLHPAIHRVQDAIAADLVKPRSQTELAKIAAASGRHLSRLFHEHVGMSIVDYANRLRVAHAQALLRETRLDMERVAEQSGFSSPRQLHRAWRKHFPTPPRAARQQVRPRALPLDPAGGSPPGPAFISK